MHRHLPGANLLFAILLVGLAALPGRADSGPERYTWRAPLHGSWTNDVLYFAAIPPAVWDGSEVFPADLRVYDENGREWPFYLAGVRGREHEITWEARVVAQTVEPSPVRHLRYTVNLQARPARPEARHHQAVLIMAGHDYDRRVEVLGCNEGQPWEWLGQANLISRPGELRAGNRNVFYEPSGYTQLQFRVYPSTPVPDEPLVLLGLSVLNQGAPDREVWLDMDWVPRRESSEPGLQSLEADLGYRNLPVRYLRLDLGPGEGAFPVKVYGRTSTTNNWRWMADGGVTPSRGRRRAMVELQQTGYRYLRMDLLHAETSPVQVVTAQAGYEPLYLVVEADYGHHPHLYFGAVRPPLPRYDLQRRVGPGLPPRAQAASIGERGRNPARIAATLRRYGRTLAWSAAGVTAGLVILILVNRWRHRPA